MRVLSILHTVDPRSGGPLHALRSRAEAMAAVGATFTAATCDDPATPVDPGLPFRVIAAGPGRNGFGYAPGLVPALERALPGHDAVVVHGLWQYHGVAARRVCRAAGRRYVVFAHGMLDPWFRRRYPAKHLKKQLFWWLAEYRVLRDAHAVLYTSEEERRLAEGGFWPWRGIAGRVVPYGTRDPGPATPDQETAFRAAVPGLADRPYLLYLGRIHEKKGPEELVAAYLAMDRPPFDLVLAGPGDAELIARIARRVDDAGAAGRVHRPGLLEGDAKWGAFRGASAFVLPSHQENFGIAVAEALACATPVLISDRVNIWREIVDDGAGFAEPDTPAGTRALLDRWAAAPSEARRAMGEAARRCFLGRFEVDRSSQAYLALLKEIAP